MLLSTSRSSFPSLPDKLAGLADLADNLWWSWRPRVRMIFKMLNRQALEESSHKPFDYVLWRRHA